MSTEQKILDLRIIRGEDLGATDIKSRKSDPYVVVKVGNKLFRTKKKKGTLNPIWNEDCTFLINKYKEAPLLRLVVYCHDDFLGEARIPTKMITRLNKKNIEYPLTLGNPNNYKLKKGLKIKGKILIRISISYSFTSGILSHFGRPLNNFHLRVKPGDIILLDHQRIDGVLVSAGTASRWNHIGIIVPGTDGDLFFFEATIDGVELSPLEQSLQEWKNIVPSLSFGFRRLEGINPKEQSQMEENLEAFARANVSKPYEKNLLELARGFFKANKKEDWNTFFCSELVAACWKAMGILASDQISSNFLPKQFGKKKMKLEKGITVSHIIEYKDWADPEKKLRVNTNISSKKPIISEVPKSPKKPLMDTEDKLVPKALTKSKDEIEYSQKLHNDPEISPQKKKDIQKSISRKNIKLNAQKVVHISAPKQEKRKSLETRNGKIISEKPLTRQTSVPTIPSKIVKGEHHVFIGTSRSTPEKICRGAHYANTPETTKRKRYTSEINLLSEHRLSSSGGKESMDTGKLPRRQLLRRISGPELAVTSPQNMHKPLQNRALSYGSNVKKRKKNGSDKRVLS